AVQLALTWELIGIAGFRRTDEQLSNYAFPLAHWSQPALPMLFLDLGGGSHHDYWKSRGTTGSESCFYIGTVPLILAMVGLLGDGRDRNLAPWRLLVAVSLGLACLPLAWPEAHRALLRLPVLGSFRSPSRYTVL